MGKEIPSISDKILVERCKSGCVEAFETLLARHHAKVFALAFKLTRNQEDAEEVFQDVFVTVFRKIHTFNGSSAFSSWIYRVTANAAFMKLRKRKRYQHISFDELSDRENLSSSVLYRRSVNEESLAVRQEVHRVVVEAIQALPDQYRDVFILRDIDSLSSMQVSKELDLTVPAVKSRLHRSRVLMRRRLKRYWAEYRSTGRTTQSAQARMAG